MKIIPPPGMALIKEDKKDFANASIDIPEHAIRGVGTQGTIIAVTNVLQDKPTLYFEALAARCPSIKGLPVDVIERIKDFCSAMERGHDPIPEYKEGDHVLYSKFTEQISVMESGKETIYYSVPVQAILAVITDN